MTPEALVDQEQLILLTAKDVGPIIRIVNTNQVAAVLAELTSQGVIEIAGSACPVSDVRDIRSGVESPVSLIYYQNDGHVLVADTQEVREQAIRSRQESVYTPEELIKLASARVLIAGASTGGVIAESIIHTGVAVGGEGSLTIADFDNLSLHNLARGGWGLGEVGTPKAINLAHQLWGFCPEMKINILPEGVPLAGLKLEQFIGYVKEEGIQYIFEQTDSMMAKIVTRLIARDLGLVLMMATDLDPAGYAISCEDYRKGQMPLFHGRLEKLVPGLDWQMLEQINPGLIKQLAPFIVGFENLPRKTLQAFMELSVGRNSGVSQTLMTVGSAAGHATELLVNDILGVRIEHEAVGLYPSLMPEDRQQQRVEDLDYMTNFITGLATSGLPEGLLDDVLHRVSQRKQQIVGGADNC